MENKHDKALILWFDEIGIEDVPMVGGKNASLGEMHQKLTSKGVEVPNGYAITAYAYQYLLKEAGVEAAIRDALAGLDTHDLRNLQARGAKVRDIVRTAEFPADLREAILSAYRTMEKEYGPDVDVAVRSSATAEDLPDASFAGQQETYLNIRGPEALIDACKRCFASLFTDRAISYRHDKGFDQFDVYLSIVVQKMVRSDSACSGVMFSIDTEIGLQGRGLHHRRLGARRERGPGRGQPGRVLRFQADPQRRQAADRRQADRHQGNQDDLQHRPGRCGAGEKHPHHPGGARRLHPQRRRDPAAGALGLHHRGPLRHGPWTSSGPRTATVSRSARAGSSSSRPGRRRSTPRPARRSWKPTCSRRRAPCSPQGQAVGAKIGQGVGQRHPAHGQPRSTTSRRARCWSPT